MELIANQEFRNQEVRVDGQQFQRCLFENARIVYGGGALPTFIDCKFNNIRLEFTEGAANTIAFLGGMQAGGFRAAVSKLTQAIRQHKV
jgi:hypothetical protein